MNSSSSIYEISMFEMKEFQENGRSIVAYFAILMIIGFIGNIHVSLIYGRKGIEFNYQIFITALAINDFLACTLIIPNEIVFAIYNYTYRNVAACKFFHFLSCTLVLTSVLLFMLIGLERNRCICTPFKEQLTRKTVLIACGAVSAISALISLPVLGLFGVVKSEMTQYPYLNGTKCGFSADTYTHAYFGVILLIGTIIFIFLVGAYFMIARVLLRQRHYAIKIPSNKDEFKPRSDCERLRNNTIAIRNTISLMFVTLFSYMGSIPLFILVLINFADEKVYEKAIADLGVAGSFILMKGYFINNVVNPIVYTIVEKQFREGIKNIYVDVWVSLKRQN